MPSTVVNIFDEQVITRNVRLYGKAVHLCLSVRLCLSVCLSRACTKTVIAKAVIIVLFESLFYLVLGKVSLANVGHPQLPSFWVERTTEQ